MIVVNLGVSGCHLSVVANIANPIEQNKPNIQPKKVPHTSHYKPLERFQTKIQNTLSQL